MKQGQRIECRLGCGALIIYECSNTENFKRPRLTLLVPEQINDAPQNNTPAKSVQFYSEEVKDLYAALKIYFGEDSK